MSEHSEQGLIGNTLSQVNKLQSDSSETLRKEAEKLKDEGKMYAAGEHLSTAAELKSRLKTTDSQMDAAILYEKAATYYRAANYCIEAANNVERAANIHISLDQTMFAIKCYAMAKNYYGDAGDYSKCGEAYVKEMKTKEKYYFSMIRDSEKTGEKISNGYKYLLYFLFRKTMGYGESLKALMMTGIILISFFTLLYFMFQLVVLPDDNIQNLFYIVPEYNLEYLYACFKLSMSLFTGFSTTPYQLYELNLLSTIEVLFGNLFLALFIAIVIRKISRR